VRRRRGKGSGFFITWSNIRLLPVLNKWGKYNVNGYLTVTIFWEREYFEKLDKNYISLRTSTYELFCCILYSSDTGERMGVQWDCTSAIYRFQESL
jgi:hypothetical protein